MFFDLFECFATMSGPGQRAGQQDWQWSDTMRAWYRFDPRLGQYLLYNRGHPVPAPRQRTQDPRNEHLPSSSEVRNSSRPEIAGSPPDRSTPYLLQGGQQYRSDAHSSIAGQCDTTSGHHGYRSTSSTQSTSPPTSAFASGTTRIASAGTTSQTAGQGSLYNRSDQYQQGQTNAERLPSSSRRTETSSLYSPQAPPFLPRAPGNAGPQHPYTAGASSMKSGEYPTGLDGALSRFSISSNPSNQSQALRYSTAESSRRGDVDFTDPQNKVRTVSRSQDVTTDPDLKRFGITAHKYLSGTDWEVEKLYPCE